MRYGAAMLDWPYDEEGTVVDLDDAGADKDVYLMPMLQVIANRIPARAQDYNITYTPNTDRGNAYYYPYILLIPLSPVGNQGQTTAFQGMVAYGDIGWDNIDWLNAQLVWVVQAPHDQRLDDGTIVHSLTPVAKYVESKFQVTGMELLRSVGFESALVATPDDVDDDQPLFQTLFGLSATFLTSQQLEGQPVGPTFLQYATTQFNSDNNLWGITSTVRMARTFAADRNSGMDALNAEHIPAFLAAQGYGAAGRASLVLATEEKLGTVNLQNLAYSWGSAAWSEWSYENRSRFMFDVVKIPLVTQARP